MTVHLKYRPAALLCCLLLAGCANSLKPRHSYAPPPGAAPTEYKSVETGELRATAGHKGSKLGAEVVSSETIGEDQLIEVSIPIDPDDVDQVYITSPSGEPFELSREAQIIQNYETNDVGIKFQVPKSKNLNFQLQLIDTRDDDWPPFREQ